MTVNSSHLCWTLMLSMPLVTCGGDRAESSDTGADPASTGSGSGTTTSGPITSGGSESPETGGNTATSGTSGTSSTPEPTSGDTTTTSTGPTDPSESTTDDSTSTSDNESSSESSSSSTSDGTTGGESDCAPEKTIIVPDNQAVLLDEPGDVQALAGIECIEGSVQLYGSAGSLQPLASLRRISGWLGLSGEGFSEGLLGLENLEGIGGLTLSETDMIDLSGLEGLKESGQIDLHLNFQLVSLDGLDGLQHIDGGLYLGSFLKGSNTNLASIAALAALEDISGDLEIDGSGLDSLTGLEQLKSVGGYVHIRGNKKLPTCQAVAFVDSVDIMGPVEIFSNLEDRCGG